MSEKGRRAQQKIYKASLRLFNSKGFVETTLKDICAEAEIGIGTFYHYFRSKMDILEKFVQEEQAAVFESMNSRTFTVYRERIVALADHLHDFVELEGKNFLAHYLSNDLLQEERQSIFSSHVLGSYLEEYLEKGEAAGEFRCARSRQYVETVLRRFLIGDVVFWAASREEGAPSRFSREDFRNLVDLLLLDASKD